jgi:transposase
MWRMAMGTRQSEQASMWVASAELPKSPGPPFYTRLSARLDADDFDRLVEGQCAKFYAPVMGRPSLAPGRYFRLLLVGYFEGIDSERGIAWRASDSLAVRSFLRLPVEEPPPDHSTISRTRRAIDLESHRAVFTWVQQRLVAAGLLKGKTVAVDATTLEANAAMRSIGRRETEESYQEFLTGLAQASGIKTPTGEDLARLDRKRKKKTSNQDWKHPWDPEAKVAKMKDGRTHLAQPSRRWTWRPARWSPSPCKAPTKAIPRRSSKRPSPQRIKAKTRKPQCRHPSRWQRSSPTRAITAIRR